MDLREILQTHYSGADLEDTILGALAATGADTEALTVADLAAADQLHLGFVPATRYLLDKLDLGPAARLLDVGCGLGGPARLAAAAYSCRVSGVDLAPDFTATATALTKRVGLSDLVEFHTVAGQGLPFDDGAFDRAMMIHVGMNIDDKPAVFAQVRRVLRPGGLFGLFDQVRAADGALPYPLPWADDERSSFVESAEEYTAYLAAAGFAVESVEDRTAAAPPPPDQAMFVGPNAIFGPAFATRIRNNATAIGSGLLAPTLVIARAV